MKRLANKFQLVLKRGYKLPILLSLLWNRVLMMRLKLYKWFYGIYRPIIHYYAVCWNEEKMLPFVFDYFGLFVDRFIIYDNGSTDQSIEIVNARHNAKLVHFETEGFDDTVHAQIKNNCWKRSRGKADYVIVCDIDEFAYHPDISKYLIEIANQHISIPTPVGYNMYSTTFPLYQKGDDITKLVQTGVPDDGYSKCILFDPHRVVEINYDAGAHICHPWGQIKRGGEYKVLHYKNLDIEAVLTRTRINAERLSPANREQNLGYAYLYPEERIRKEFEENLKASQIVTE